MPSVISDILQVFSGIGQWFSEIIPTLLAIFYTPATETADGGLTVIGALAVCGLAIGVVMLILNLVRSFFRFS